MRHITAQLILMLLLTAAGRGADAGAVPPGSAPLIKPFGTMNEPRASHTATMLQDGRILIAGGFHRSRGGEDESYSSTAEIYDPRTGRFSLTGDMSYQRGGHTATLLTGGLVLVAGGWNLMGALSSAELYDPSSGKFTTIGSMTMRRGGCTATLLNDGRVLITGGSSRDVTASAELFDPVRKSFSAAGSMTVPRYSHTATLIRDGLVLITGGLTRREGTLSSAEIFDPGAGTFTAIGDMAAPRAKHGCIELARGDVVVVGGTDGTSWRGDLAIVERFEIAARKFVRIPDLARPRARMSASLAPLPDGSLVVTGGDASIERIASSDGKTGPSTIGVLDRAYYYSTATTLSDGSVLILGGYDDGGQTTDKAWIIKR
ncbi:MAG TPA: kelch repeat-containing protein [Bacteroidota bacterium]|nr:kelch repeat-containing protein [Bacteroidota bacterium]